MCARCRKVLKNVADGNSEPSALGDPVDFSALSFPVMTRKFGGMTDLGSLQNCQCSICSYGRANPGQTGNRFGGKDKQGPFPLGRPPLPGPKRLSKLTPKPIRKCKRCEQIIGKGVRHPQPCGISDRRENLQ